MKGMPHERIPSSPTFLIGDPGCRVVPLPQWEGGGPGFPIKDVACALEPFGRKCGHDAVGVG